MGCPWTTPEQLVWLRNQIPAFLQAQCEAKTARFHQLTSEAWFQAWLELIEEDTLVQRSAIVKRKTQLQQWFLWNLHPVKRARVVKPFSLFSTKKGTRERLPQRVEAYQQLCGAKVAPEITKEIKEAGKIDSNRRLEIVKDTPAQMFAKEPPEVHAAVDAYIQMEKEKKKKRMQEQGSLDSDEDDPHKLNAAIQDFPNIVDGFLKSAADVTGWVIHLIAAGPNPAAGGEILSVEQYFGPTSMAGNTFQQAYAGYEQHVEGPFLSHVQGIFPPNVRRKCTIQDVESIQKGDVPEDPQERISQPPDLNLGSLITLHSGGVSGLEALGVGGCPRGSNSSNSFTSEDLGLPGKSYDSSMDVLFQKLDHQFGHFTDGDSSPTSSNTSITTGLTSTQQPMPNPISPSSSHIHTLLLPPLSTDSVAHTYQSTSATLEQVHQHPITDDAMFGETNLSLQLQAILDIDLPPPTIPSTSPVPPAETLGMCVPNHRAPLHPPSSKNSHCAPYKINPPMGAGYMERALAPVQPPTALVPQVPRSAPFSALDGTHSQLPMLPPHATPADPVDYLVLFTANTVSRGVAGLGSELGQDAVKLKRQEAARKQAETIACKKAKMNAGKSRVPSLNVQSTK